jgi:hypothetical protein
MSHDSKGTDRVKELALSIEVQDNDIFLKDLLLRSCQKRLH